MKTKLEKAQQRLTEAKFEREKKKVIYDTNIIILEGQRNVVKNIESRSQDLLAELSKSDASVATIENELQILINENHEKDN